LVQSDVEIYYQGISDPTEEEVGDMKNLLIETILSQSSGGSFASLGAIDSVEVDGAATSASNSTDGENQERGNLFADTDDEEPNNDFMKFVYAAIAASIVCGVACLYGTSGEDDEKSKDRDTSDSEDDRGTNNAGWMGGWVKPEEPAEETKQEKKKEQTSTATTTSSNRVNSAGQAANKESTAQKKTTSSKKEEPKQEEGWLESVFGAGWFECAQNHG
jgi:hypothetical protein